MNISLSELVAEGSPLMVVAAAAALLFVVFLFVVIWAARYRKVGPDEVLIVYGRKVMVRDAEGKEHACGYRIVKGGGTLVFPVVEEASTLSLKPVALEVSLPRVIPCNGGSLRVDARAQVRTKPDDVSLASAAEALLGKSQQQIQDLGGQMLENSIYEVAGSRNAQEMLQNPGELAKLVQAAAEPKLAGLGLELLSFAVRDVAVAGRETTSTPSAPS